MNVTQVGQGQPAASAHRRPALYASLVLAVLGVGLAAIAVFDGARLELLLAALALVAGAALVALLTD